ncbi:DNA ligase N terminus-domain-containing protein [Xylogone sp. PMI_703]|nr:DNA ligase N terminus-domain-containing protein [Xylogone sp. PMI_703]
MPFKFVYVCDLLEDLEHIATRDPPLIPKEAERQQSSVILNWFKSHRRKLDAFDTDSEAVLSALLPQRTAGRCYGLPAKILARAVARILNLSQKQLAELKKWMGPAYDGDLALFVHQILDKDPAVRSRTNLVTVEEIDQSLLRIASHNAQSFMKVRSLAASGTSCDVIGLLDRLYCRLHPREAKWLTRLIQKDYVTVKFPETITYSPAHSLLPNIFPVQATFPIGSAEASPKIRQEIEPRVSSSSSDATPGDSASDLLCSAPVSLLPDQATPATVMVSSAGPHCNNSTTSCRRELPSPKCVRVYLRTPCRLLNNICSLANCVFILSPHVTTISSLAASFLPWHGNLFSDSLSILSDPSVPLICPLTGKRLRRIALVDLNHKKDAVEFMKQISSLDLKRPSGKKQWIEVYDWRLLELVSKVEIGKNTGCDPWRKSWIVAV